MPLRLLGLLAVATVAVAVTPQPAAADAPIAAAASETPISAYGGWTAWSSYDTAGAVRETPAQTKLAGGLALDAGRLTYLELQGTSGAQTSGPEAGAVAVPLIVNAKADVVLSTSATAAPSGGQVTFSGTVDPAQPGRTVKVQRLIKRNCAKSSDGRQFCQEDFETVADAPLAADGRSFSATASLSQSGEYTAALPFVRFDEPGADTAYSGRSAATLIPVG